MCIVTLKEQLDEDFQFISLQDPPYMVLHSRWVYHQIRTRIRWALFYNASLYSLFHSVKLDKQSVTLSSHLLSVLLYRFKSGSTFASNHNEEIAFVAWGEDVTLLELFRDAHIVSIIHPYKEQLVPPCWKIGTFTLIHRPFSSPVIEFKRSTFCF